MGLGGDGPELGLVGGGAELALVWEGLELVLGGGGPKLGMGGEKIIRVNISASADGGPRSRVRACGTLRSAPHRH